MLLSKAAGTELHNQCAPGYGMGGYLLMHKKGEEVSPNSK